MNGTFEQLLGRAKGGDRDAAQQLLLSTQPETAAAQEEIGAIMQTGAAVASIRYASLTRETFLESVSGRMTEPTVRQLK